LEHWLRILSKKRTGAPLFSSPVIAACLELAGRMRKFFAKNGMNLLVQGAGLPRTLLLEQFQDYAAQRAFWDGQFLDGRGRSGRRAL